MRPDRPRLEKVNLHVSSQKRDQQGRIVFQAWVIQSPDCEKFQKNTERMWAYVYALEQAPFWEGDPPPRID